MKVSHTLHSAVLVLLVGAYSAAFAQKFEINPYIGGTWPTSFLEVDLDNSMVYGIRGSMALSTNFDVGGNLGRVNQVQLTGTDSEIGGWRWEGLGAYNFRNAQFKRFFPFVKFGVGGLSISVKDPILGEPELFARIERTVIPPGGDPITTVEILELDGARSFLSYSYGGGVKAPRLWGPWGLRFDVGGHTAPKFFDESVTWFDINGGITLSWGEP